jgi:hypothetical protein
MHLAELGAEALDRDCNAGKAWRGDPAPAEGLAYRELAGLLPVAEQTQEEQNIEDSDTHVPQQSSFIFVFIPLFSSQKFWNGFAHSKQRLLDYCCRFVVSASP